MSTRPVPLALVDEADGLFRLRHDLAAACLLHAALTIHLRALCDAIGCIPPVLPPGTFPRSYRYLEAIQRRKIIDKLSRNLLKKVLAVTADALYGIPCGPVRFARYLQVAREFIATTEGAERRVPA